MVIDFNNRRSVIVNARNGDKGTKNTSDEFYGWTSDTVEDSAERYSDVEPLLILIGYILMILYCGLTFLYFNWVNSHVSVGLVSDKYLLIYVCLLRLGVTIGGLVAGGTCFCSSSGVNSQLAVEF